MRRYRFPTSLAMMSLMLTAAFTTSIPAEGETPLDLVAKAEAAKSQFRPIAADRVSRARTRLGEARQQLAEYLATGMPTMPSSGRTT